MSSEESELVIARRTFVTGAASSIALTGATTARTSGDGDGYGEASYGEDPYGGSDTFSVSTEDPTNIEDTSATLNGSLNDLDGADSADCYFEWRRVGTDTWNTTSKQTLSSTGSFSESIGDLDDGVDYEYRAVAEASDGDSDTGSTVSFTTTENSPAVTTDSPTDISDSSATLNGSLNDLGGANSADCYFQYRPVGADTWSTTTVQTLSSTGSFSEQVTGLDSSTEYEYNAITEASDGDSDSGDVVTFTTSGGLPGVSTESASDLTDTSATLNGSLDDLGGADSADCYFEWRQAGADTWNTTSKQTLSSTGSFNEDLTSLEDGTDYEYRAVADASDGDSDTGGTVSFTTTENSPAVTTDSPTDISDTSATLNGSLDDLGGADSADCYFEWRQAGADTWNTTSKQTLSSTGSFNEDLTGLEDGTDYEYRAVAEASDGDTDTGGTVSFTTKSSNTAPEIDSYSVTEAGKPNPHAEITADWSVSDTDGNLDTADVSVFDSSGTLVDSATTKLSGASASGTDKFKIKHVDGETFEVELTVVDTGGKTTSDTQSVTE